MRQVILLGSMLYAAGAVGQAKPSAAIPATAPTQTPMPSSVPALQPERSVPSSLVSGTGHVTWNGATLRIEGAGDSLRNILWNVARQTGMKITGNVPDERVFGSYGPAPVQQILTELFSGIAVNMMLMNGTATQPKELILTARNGAASPPASRPPSEESAQGSSNNGLQNGFGPPPQFARQPQPGANTDQAPSGPPMGTPAPDAGNSASATSGANAGGQPPSDAARTPEQIFEELRRRQQRQQQGGQSQ